MAGSTRLHRSIQLQTMRYSFAWLLAANSVGLLLSVLLLWPQTGRLLGILTYGRWMPLHMEWQLYGWCTLPLIGLILKEFLRDEVCGEWHTRYVFVLWSLGLLAGGATCLAGHASGKLFLSWHGFSRILFPIILFMIWCLLTWNWIRDWQNTGTSRARRSVRGLLLVVLAIVPASLFFASSRQVYPPVDPNSGGATGHSLLASSLSILGLFGVVPALLQRSRTRSMWIPAYWIGYTACGMAYLFMQHGSVGNANWDQIVGLGTLLLMVPLLVFYINSWKWPTGSRPWLVAFLVWWGMLTLSGWITFLPGILDRLKFTNGLVAHAHLAMAGMITCFNFLLMSSLDDSDDLTGNNCFAGRRTFMIWNLSCLVMVVSLMIQGWREGAGPGVLYGKDPFTTAVYLIRAAAGLAMAWASWNWLRLALKSPARKEIWNEN